MENKNGKMNCSQVFFCVSTYKNIEQTKNNALNLELKMKMKSK